MREFVSLYPARDILDVDSSILVNARVSMHVLHACTNCKYQPASSLSRLRHGVRNMNEFEIFRRGNLYVFITSCDDAICQALNKARAQEVKLLADKKYSTLD